MSDSYGMLALVRAAGEGFCAALTSQRFQLDPRTALLKSWEAVRLRADPEQLDEQGNNLLHRKLTRLFVALDTVSSCFQSSKALKALLIPVWAALVRSAPRPFPLIGEAASWPNAANSCIPALRFEIGARRTVASPLPTFNRLGKEGWET